MAKDSPRTTAEEVQKIVEPRGQKTLKKTEPDLNPVENEWGELKRRSTNMELGI